MFSRISNQSRILRTLGVAGLIAAAGIATLPADAGFKSDGWPGNGFVPSDIPAAPAALTAAQMMYLDAVKAANPGLSDADARTKATNIHMGLCKAVALVKKQNATVGACLEKLKMKGSICISFNMKKAVGGARNDGKADCNENDKINVSSKKLAEGCPPAYDAKLYWLATVLLHEGTHAGQDYGVDTTGLDACKARAKKTKQRLCNEAGTGMNGEPKGAHVVENEWIAEIKAALDELEMLDPMIDPAWSDATKDMFNGINPLAPAARQDAIDALRKAACANKKGNDDAIDCYRQAKMKLQDFIDTNYTTPEEKAAALKTMRDCLDVDKWKWIFKFFDIPAKAIVSTGGSGVIQQFEDESNVDDLNTGLLGVSDMELAEDAAGGGLLDALIVVGPTAPDQGQVQVYIDSNENNVFEPSELNNSFPTPPGLTGYFDLILPREPLQPTLLFNHDTFEFFVAQPDPLTGLPIGIDPLPVFQIQLPPLVDLAHFIQEWDWDGNRLVGYDDTVTAAPALPFDDEVLVLEDQNGDGLPDLEVPFATVLPLIQFGPTWGGLPLPNDPILEVWGYPNHQIEIQVVDPNYIPVEIIGLSLASIDPIDVNLSRPLLPGDVILLQDLNNGLQSPPLFVNCPGDLNGDGTTDTADLGILLSQFGSPLGGPADFNGDGVVDTADLGILLANFGCPN
ncbi:MAG: hypothetical protein H6813_05505 [Phycisphaeraceae bacterium]|nr:hypothetical protein [Phycisphaeraceae bacterium]MCB9847924.1 hypothetical protein [Phycisphaeraceae bacterium]